MTIRTALVGVEGLAVDGNDRVGLFGVEGLVPQRWGYRATGTPTTTGTLDRNPQVPAIVAGDWRFMLSTAKIQTGSTISASGPAGITKVAEFEHSAIEWIMSAFVEHDETTAVTLTRTAGTLDVWAAVEFPLTYYGTDPLEVTQVDTDEAAGLAATFRPSALTDVPAGSVVVVMVSQDDNNGLSLSDAQGFQLANDGSTSTGSDLNWGFAWAEIPVDTATLTLPEFSAAADRWMSTAIVVSPVSVPDAPSNPTASADSATQITVSWDDAADETGYRVERSADGSTGWSDVSGALAADVVSYADTGLTENTTYYYRVVAVNAVGDSDPSSVVDATTLAASTGEAQRIGGTGAIRKPPVTTRR